MHVLPPGRLGRQELAKRRAVVGRGLRPVALDGVPALAQPLLIRVAVLRDDRGDPLRMARRETEADRRAVVEDVDSITVEPGDRGEPSDDVGEVIERIPELRPVRGVGEAETGQVGGDDVVVVRQGRDQVTEHVGRGWEAVKQEQRWRRVGPRFSVEDLEAVHLDDAVSRPAHLVPKGTSPDWPSYALSL